MISKYGQGIRVVVGYDNFGKFYKILKNGKFIGDVYISDDYFDGRPKKSYCISSITDKEWNIKDLQDGINNLVLVADIH